MEKIIYELACKIEPREVIYFLVMLGLFGVVIFQETSFRRKDKLFQQIINDLRQELSKHGTALTELTGVVSFLAFNTRQTDTLPDAKPGADPPGSKRLPGGHS